MEAYKEAYKTPPLTRNKRSFTENSCYEYDSQVE
jgi:hypothetical protein